MTNEIKNYLRSMLGTALLASSTVLAANNNNNVPFPIYESTRAQIEKKEQAIRETERRVAENIRINKSNALVRARDYFNTAIGDGALSRFEQIRLERMYKKALPVYGADKELYDQLRANTSNDERANFETKLKRNGLNVNVHRRMNNGELIVSLCATAYFGLMTLQILLASTSTRRKTK